MISIARRHSTWASFILLLMIVVILGTAFFFFLHYLGNRIMPHDLALSRVQDFETELSDKKYLRGYHDPYEDCELFASVMRSVKVQAAESHSLHNAILPQGVLLYGGSLHSCLVLLGAVSGGDPEPALLGTRYWWGNKVMHTFGLRFLSLAQFRQTLEIAIYLAYGALIVSLAMLRPRAALIAVPLAVFGVFCSGVRYFADASNGVPYLWAVLAAVILSILVRQPSTNLRPLIKVDMPTMVQKVGVVSTLFCFVAGMISSFLFFRDGHIVLAITLFGLVAWFGSPELEVRDRTQRVFLIFVSYIFGFLACYILNQLVKIVVDGIFYRNVPLDSGSVLSNFGSGLAGLDGPLPLERFHLFWTIGLGGVATGKVLSVLSLVAFGTAMLIAVQKTRRGHWDLLWDVLLIVVLMTVVCLWLVVPNDIAGRASRFLFINYGLGWSCLILAIMKMGWRSRAVIGASLIAFLSVWLWVRSDRVEDIKRSFERVMDGSPIFAHPFKVYLVESSGSVIYVKENCNAEDIVPEFWVALVFSTDNSDRQGTLYTWRKKFYFEDYGVTFAKGGDGKWCVARVPLPDITSLDYIETGQYDYFYWQNIWIQFYRIG